MEFTEETNNKSFEEMFNSSLWNDSANTPALDLTPPNKAITYGYVLLVAVTAFFGTFGNVLVIGAILVHKKLRVLSNIFIANLAMADLIVSAIINPFSIVGVLTKGEFFFRYPVICDIVSSFCIMSCSCSIWNIAAISINRYICICHRLVYHDIYTKCKMPFYVFGLWFLCFQIDLPIYFGWGAHAFDTKAFYCAYNYLADYSYTLFSIGLGFVTPMTLVTCCYIRILLFARSVKRDLYKITNKEKKERRAAGNQKIKQNDLRLLRSIATIWIAFMVMWTPYASVVIFDFHGTWSQWFFITAVALGHTNSSINCILYAATNKNFREGYIKFLCLCIPGKKRLRSNNSDINIISDSKSSSFRNASEHRL